MAKLAYAHRDHAKFVYVYCREAHAKDVWPLGSEESYRKHRSLQERCERALHFSETYAKKSTHDASLKDAGGDEEEESNKDRESIPVFCDTMRDEFDEAFAVWPERYFAVRGGKVALVAEPTNEFGYDRGILEHWLEMQQDLFRARAAKHRFEANDKRASLAFAEASSRQRRGFVAPANAATAKKVGK
eukprot:g4549.t1